MPLRDMDREQIWLVPPSLDELLPLDHPGRFVAEFVDGLDREGWAELGVEIEGDPLGAPAYHHRALLCVWLYGFMTGLRSCRKLEAACRGSDTVSMVDWLATSRPQHPMGVLQGSPAGYEGVVQAHRTHGRGDGVG